MDPKEKIQQAVKAALIAGAGEAFRSRKEPGGWTGDKGKRVLTAAIGAGGIDGLLGSGKDGKSGGTMQTIESVIGGLAGNRLINGSRDKDGSRSRSRSRGGRRDDEKGGGLAGLAAGGLAAAAGKAFMDRNKSADRGRRGSSSDDSRRGGRGKRSKSVSDYVKQGVGKLGLGGAQGKDGRDSRGSRRGHDDYDYPPPRPRGGGGEGGDGIRSQPGSSYNSSHDSSSEDDVSSSEEERTRKKMGRKELITAGLASVATIHAGQSVYKSLKARDARANEVATGEMSPQEARKKKNKARLQDAASIGIAALGIKGAYSEWKEMREQRHEAHEFDEKRKERHERRLAKLEHQHQYGSTHGYGDSHDQYRASAPDLQPTGYHPGVATPQFQSATNLNSNGYNQPGYNNTGYNQAGYNGASAGPQYADGNPYAYAGMAGGVPPPPMGPQQARYQ